MRLKGAFSLLGFLMLFYLLSTVRQGTVNGSGLSAQEETLGGKNILAMKRWSPYVVGAAIGMLSWLTFLFLDKPLGCSTAFSHTAGMIERAFRGDKVKENPYYQKTAPTIDWQWMLVIGILFGALASSMLSRDFQLNWVPSKWASRFGTCAFGRWLMALVGGVCIGFGARWAGGCTSGHGISGILQLAASGWISAVCFFIGGIATAMLLFH